MTNEKRHEPARSGTAFGPGTGPGPGSTNDPSLDRDPARYDESSGLPQRLMGAFIRINRRHWQRRAGGDLRPHEFGLLHALRRLSRGNEAGPRASELSEFLGVTPPTVTQQVSDLERRGLVERRMDSADRRSVRVALSPLGAEALEKHREGFLALFAQVADKLGAERAETLALLLDEAAAHMESLDEASEDAGTGAEAAEGGNR